MRVLHVRNVHEVIPMAVELLQKEGVLRNSRNGDVLVVPGPVATVYERPWERVVFWRSRDANPFFHLYESLWMLAGRRDVLPLLKYTKQMAEYSDDGKTLNDAYGYRWRHYYAEDQLHLIIKRLRENANDRRCVLQMWDANADLDHAGRAVPCNVTATFQISHSYQLEMVVFNRSNDVVWGAYGANAVHFSMLQEYMAKMIGVGIGRYTQISVNWHAYLDTFSKIKGVTSEPQRNPYLDPGLVSYPLEPEMFDSTNQLFLAQEEGNFSDGLNLPNLRGRFWEVAACMLRAHAIWRTEKPPKRFQLALRSLEDGPSDSDWIVAGAQWLKRRHGWWLEKQETKKAKDHETLGWS